MNLEKLSNYFYLKSLASIELDPEEMQLLLKINRAPNHFLVANELTKDERFIANEMVDLGYLYHIPKNSKLKWQIIETPFLPPTQSGKSIIVPSEKELPERYVISIKGSHAIGTFKYNLLYNEINKMNKEK